jgi:hypothetical protein
MMTDKAAESTARSLLNGFARLILNDPRQANSATINADVEIAYARGEPILRMTGVDGQHASAGFALP